MKAIILALISLFAVGNLQAAHPQPTEVQEGDNVTIQCQTHPTTNLETLTLDVKRIDGNSSDLSVVYSRRHGKDHPTPQMEQYRNRVFLINEDLKKGVMTVEIHSVQRSDSGRYKCYIPSLRNASYFTIVVKDKQNWTKENDFTTMATSVEEPTGAGAATENHGVITAVIIIAILCLLGGVVFLVHFKKGICKSRRNRFKLKTLNAQPREGDEEEQLEKPSAGGVGGLAG